MLLHKYSARLERRIDITTGIIDEIAKKSRRSMTESLVVERAIMQLQIDWELFVRNFVLSCAIGKYHNSRGRVVSGLPTRLRSTEDASKKLVSMYKKQKNEPNWYETSKAIDASNKLMLSNHADIVEFLSITPWVIDDLRYLRNFIAHRSKRSALEVRKIVGTKFSDKIEPVDTALSYDITGQRRYHSWAKFIKFIGWQLVK